MNRLMNYTRVIGVENPNEVERCIIENDFLVGILFHHSANIKELPKDLSYTLRFPSELRYNYEGLRLVSIFNWKTNLLYPLESGGGPNGGDGDMGGVPQYHSDGFLTIQNSIACAYIQIKCNETDCKNDAPIPKIHMQRYPYPPFVADNFLDALEIILPLFIILAFAYSIIATVRLIGVEKEKQLKEVMKIMGMPIWLHWFSWFFRSIIFFVISISIMVALLKVSLILLQF